MKTSQKIAILIALALIVIGLLICLFSFAAMDFDYTKLNTMRFTSNTYDIEEPFTHISIQGAESNVRFLVSEDDTCHVQCHEGDKISHRVAVENDTLTIERIDSRKWYEHIGIYWGSMEILVCLPRSEYDSLYVKSLSGNITVPDNFTFRQAELSTMSGKASFSAAVAQQLSVKTVSGSMFVGHSAPQSLTVQSTSGDVTLQAMQVQNDLYAKTVSGDMKWSQVSCSSISAESTSGDLSFADVLAGTHTQIQTVSGDVKLTSCDADTLHIQTTSGDVSGRLLTEKIFLVDTTSGDVRVPPSITGGRCEIKTTSGDVHIEVSGSTSF